MAEYTKVRVIYKMYYDFPLRIVEHIAGNKMIDKQRISGLILYKDTKENIEKAKLSNQKLEQIKKLRNEMVDIEKTMERYTE